MRHFFHEILQNPHGKTCTVFGNDLWQNEMNKAVEISRYSDTIKGEFKSIPPLE